MASYRSFIVRACAVVLTSFGSLGIASRSDAVTPISGVTVSGVSSQLVGTYFSNLAPTIATQFFNRPASATTDGLYLTANDGTDPVNGVGVRRWLTEGVGLTRSNGTVTNDTAPFIKYSLGGSYNLSSIIVYNDNSGDLIPPPAGFHFRDRGVKAADITLFNNGVATDLGVIPFNFAPGLDPFTPQTITIPGSPVADSVLLTIKSNYYNDTFGPGGTEVGGTRGPDFGFVGLQEVQFTAALTPEPVTGAWLLLSGALLLSRRRKAAGGSL